MNCTRRTCWVDKVRQVGLRPPPGLSGAPVASEALGRWEGSPLDGSTAPNRVEMDGSEPLSWTAVSTRGWHQQAAHDRGRGQDGGTSGGWPVSLLPTQAAFGTGAPAAAPSARVCAPDCRPPATGASDDG